MKAVTKWWTRQRSSRGQTLIEVLIATAVVGLVITTVAAGLTFSIKNSAQSQYRTLATAEAQEVVEFLRRARVQLGWESFAAEMPGGIYCVNQLPSTSPGLDQLTAGACESGIVLAGTEFRRELDILSNTPTEVTYQITVEWLDASVTRSVVLTGEFKPWLN